MKRKYTWTLRDVNKSWDLKQKPGSLCGKAAPQMLICHYPSCHVAPPEKMESHFTHRWNPYPDVFLSSAFLDKKLTKPHPPPCEFVFLQKFHFLNVFPHWCGNSITYFFKVENTKKKSYKELNDIFPTWIPDDSIKSSFTLDGVHFLCKRVNR